MTLVVRLAAPLLAWPSPSRYRHRETEPAPTAAALYGILCAAAGVHRLDPLPNWVGQISMAVRIDRPGSALRDFQTINPPPRSRYRHLDPADRARLRTVVRADGSERKHAVLTERAYQQDQTVLWFLDDLQGHALEALSAPHFTLYAGRKACPLSFPLVLGATSLDLVTAVSRTPTVGPQPRDVQAIFFSPTHPASSPSKDRLLEHSPAHSVTVRPTLLEDWFAVASHLGQAGRDVAE